MLTYLKPVEEPMPVYRTPQLAKAPSKLLTEQKKFQHVVTNRPPISGETLQKNLMLAFYLKNAPNIFNENKRALDKMLIR